jgi:DNA invertase Pin-like site-specific DNA recombinase
MSSKDPERRREVDRARRRRQRKRAVETALETAALLLRPKTRCIAYYRVYSGEPPHPDYERAAQREAVKLLIARAGATLIDAYVQPEKRGPGFNKRLQLGRALTSCQAQGATLIIAKLGHLVDSAPILSQLAASGVDFVTCDKPKVHHHTIEALAIAAQRKEKVRREHLRTQWAAEKEAGRRRANEKFEATRKRSHEASHMRAMWFVAKIAHSLEKARRNSSTMSEIAAKLNDAGLKTRLGHKWNRSTVHKALKRVDRLPPSLMEAVERSDSPAASAAPAQRAPAATVAAKSGFPGRPTSLSRPLVEAEFWRRWAAGARHPSRRRGGGESAQAWTKDLSEWLATAHPDMPPMRDRAGRTAVAAWLRLAQSSAVPFQKREVAEITGREVAEII